MSEAIRAKGLFCSMLRRSRRGRSRLPNWNTPEAGGKVDKDTPTQVGRALQQLDIELIAAYSPEARGRSERMFGTLQKGHTTSWIGYKLARRSPPMAGIPISCINELFLRQHDSQLGDSGWGP